MIVYPTVPDEWHEWLQKHLGYSKQKASELYESKSFPTSELLDAWEREFDSSKGYTPDFIPALTRNVEGFLRWLYANGSEPNWKGSDADRCY
jgi:hypothetical protein